MDGMEKDRPRAGAALRARDRNAQVEVGDGDPRSRHVLVCEFVFFLMIRRPQGSTLFPYTTLFRSRCSARCTSHMGGLARSRPPNGLRRVCGTDRKSTRLNSSHSQISYAVFCLKKKNGWNGERSATSRRRAAGARSECAGRGWRRRPSFPSRPRVRICFFFNDSPTTGIYTLSLHDALPISMFSEMHESYGRTRPIATAQRAATSLWDRSEEHTSELQSQSNLVCRLLLEKKKWMEWRKIGHEPAPRCGRAIGMRRSRLATATLVPVTSSCANLFFF